MWQAPERRVVKFAKLQNAKKSSTQLLDLTIERAKHLIEVDRCCVIIHEGLTDLLCVNEQGMIEELKASEMRTTLLDLIADKAINAEPSALGFARLILGSSIEIPKHTLRGVR